MVPEPAPRAPGFEAEVCRWVLDDATQLQSLRASLLESITPASVPAGHALDETAESMLVVATELASNALKHGLPPTIVVLRRAGPDYLIDVVDHDPAAGLDDTRQNRPTGGGLGLVLARALALEVGWYTTTTTKHVWARFNAPD
ncbi:ATP-binding protein [Paractinoplanes globisporus]|uniref:ATP-binding protein n=1 Tax=Paractinoplanes globisporus TaxID=113565 RepID=A0ABW6WIQ1_9ACTN|nr:ATP-binding protein [Actinoplanes globisporus]